ncbi:MAG: helix-turn-helix domain-containing protein [Cyclobacteriaceae bacterium]
MKTKKIPTYNAEEFEKLNYNYTSDRLNGTKIGFNEFEIHRIEDHKDNIKFPLLPHRKTINDFIYLTEGKIIRSKGLETFVLTENQLFFLPAHNITSTDFVSQNAKGIYCHFMDELIANKSVRELHFLDISSKPIIDISENKKSQIEPLLKRLLELGHLDKQLISLYIQLILSEIHQVYDYKSSQSNTSAFVITEKFKKELLRKIYSIQTVAGFADKLNISSNHLNKCVKYTTNKTAQDWINEMIILEAKVLLRQTNKSISEIALELTNQDVSDFGRFFKSKTGLKPTEFRNKD